MSGHNDGAATPIDEVVQWSRTVHGGKQLAMFDAGPADEGCMRWGMCETHPPDAPTETP